MFEPGDPCIRGIARCAVRHLVVLTIKKPVNRGSRLRTAAIIRAVPQAPPQPLDGSACCPIVNHMRLVALILLFLLGTGFGTLVLPTMASACAEEGTAAHAHGMELNAAESAGTLSVSTDETDRPPGPQHHGSASQACCHPAPGVMLPALMSARPFAPMPLHSTIPPVRPWAPPSIELYRPPSLS